MLNPVPDTVLLAESVVNAPVLAVVEPTGPGAANVAPPSVAALTLVLQVKPELVVQFNALADVLQLGIANAVGLALDAVAFASTVFAAIAAMPLTPMPPHAGALEAPVETIACPLLEPVGFSNCTGLSVVPKAIDAENVRNTARIFFMGSFSIRNDGIITDCRRQCVIAMPGIDTVQNRTEHTSPAATGIARFSRSLADRFIGRTAEHRIRRLVQKDGEIEKVAADLVHCCAPVGVDFASNSLT